MNLQLLNNLITEAEELNPELAKSTIVKNGVTFIKHPLLTEMYVPQMNALYNNGLIYKKGLLIKFRNAKDWFSYISTYSRPYRLDAFISIIDELTDAEYWRHLTDVWIDSENIWQHHQQWKLLLSSTRPGRNNMMDAEERKYFESLPDTLTIYRGYTPRRKGFSYSLDKAVSLKFATKGGSTSNIIEKTVKKVDCICYLNSREENEIIYLK